MKQFIHVDAEIGGTIDPDHCSPETAVNDTPGLVHVGWCPIPTGCEVYLRWSDPDWWVKFSPDEARALGEMLLECADAAEGALVPDPAAEEVGFTYDAHTGP